MELFIDDNYQFLSKEYKKKDLFIRQAHTLELFLERNAISKEDYENAMYHLTKNIKMQDIRTK